jgi:hypothetical protein
LGGRLPLRHPRLLPGLLLARRRPTPLRRRGRSLARAGARIAAALAIGLTVSAFAFLTLWLRSGVGHPLHAVAIASFAAIYIGLAP